MKLYCSLGPLVNKVKDVQVETIVDTLCSNMLSEKEQLRDISSIGKSKPLVLLAALHRHIEHKRVLAQVIQHVLSVSRTIRLSVCQVYCGKMVDWNLMPCGVVGQLGPRMRQVP